MKNLNDTFKLKWIASILICVLVYGCDTEDNSIQEGAVVLSSNDLSSDGSLSIYATARFDATINVEEANLILTYEWSLLTSRGALMVNGQTSSNPTLNSSSFINVRGNAVGEETIKVKVTNSDTGEIIGEDTLTFQIVESSNISECFDEPQVFYRNTNWNNPIFAALGLASGSVSATTLESNNLFIDISPDGNWFVRQDFSDIANYKFWLDSCNELIASRLLTEGLQIFSPTFGPTGEYLYFSKLINYPEQIEDPRAMELVRLDIETGEEIFISEFRVFSGKPKISPDGNWIAFEHSQSTFNTNGTYAGGIDHLAVMPSNGGPVRFLVPIEGGGLGGIDWSPDSENIIFYFDAYETSNSQLVKGIYRVNLNGGGAPSFLFSDGENGSSAINIAYYANGTRIAFEGHPAGNDTQFDIWSVDANGSDLQRLTDETYNVYLAFIWEP